MSFLNYKKVFKLSIRLIMLAAIFSVSGLSVNYVSAQWQGPPSNPPSGNVDVPVNVGGNAQQKTGGLWVGTGLTNQDTGLVVYRGRMGIGTATPAANLHVNQGNYAAIQLGNNASGEGVHIAKSATDNSLNFFGGEVGSGSRLMTLYQNALLEVEGQLRVKGGTPGVGKVLTSDATGLASWQNPTGGGLPNGTVGQTLRNNGTSWVANSNLFNNGTDVGIGVTNPNSRLHVNGSINISSASGGVYKWGNISGIDNASCPSGQTLGAINVRGGIVTGGTCVDVGGGGGSLQWGGVNNETGEIARTGNVGVGVSNPASKLHISGGQLRVENNAAALRLQGTDHVYQEFWPRNSSGGRYGWIGYGNTGNLLSVTNQEGPVNISSEKGGITLNAETGSINPAFLTFAVDGSSRLTIEPNGNVGIGINDPDTLLTVNGQAKIKGRITIEGGNPGVNKVLTSDANGQATWKEVLNVSQGTWCGFSAADKDGVNIAPTINCLGLNPVSQCPSGYQKMNLNQYSSNWTQTWVCIKE